MHTFTKLFIGLTLTVALPQFSFAAPANQVFGWEEQAALLPEKTVIKVELDTGTETSSLAAANIVPFDKGSEKWVRFSVQVPRGLTGALVDIPFERQIVRTEKGKGLIGGGGHRQVVKMQICIGHQTYQEELVLKSPGKKDYTVTLGRSTLQHLGLVDVTLTNTVKPECDATVAKTGS